MKKTRIAALGAVLLLLAACGETEETPSSITSVEVNDSKEDTSEPTQAEESSTAATEENGGSEEASTKKASPESIYEQITTAFELPEMYIANDGWLLNKYGIDAAELKAYVCAEGDETHVDRVFIVLPAEGADKAAIKEKMGSELAQLSTEDMMSYMDNAIPGQSEYVKAASVKEMGDYLYLFISPNADGMEEILKSAVE